MDWTMVGALGENSDTAARSRVFRESRPPTRSSSNGPWPWAPTRRSRTSWSGCRPWGAEPPTSARGERAQIEFIHHALLSLTHTIYERRSERLITGGELDRWAAQNAGVMGSPYLCDIWPRMKPNFAPDYAQWLERRFNLPAVATSEE